ncbi:hypothetical protein FKV68_22410 (plasmid) [Sinorhizobium mexicanum]|uniref:Uncharacterized protein n=1 Tax=Sinorhizobium mexicanum TaxID=375549 RepID=A0A859QFW3_9HYPH|nr:hypothetical protein FKV68_22410 [Sinorhizobium mexicanum]
MIVEDPDPGQDAIKRERDWLACVWGSDFPHDFRAQWQLLAFVQRPIAGAFESMGALLAARSSR